MPKIDVGERLKYNAVLRLIADVVDLNREFDIGTAVKAEISTCWHRKTFFEYNDDVTGQGEDIELFAGHSGDRSMRRSYKDMQNVELKRLILKEAKLL